METLIQIAFLAFIAGLGFAPAKELAEKLKQAAQISTIVTALAFVVWFLLYRMNG